MDDRVSIAPETVRELIAEQFPHRAHLPVTAVHPGGWDNRTFRLGDRMGVRLPSAARYVAQGAREAEVLPRLAPQLPIPRPPARGRPGAGYPFPWSVMSWIDGEPASVVPPPDPVASAADLAGFLRALHAVDLAAPLRPRRIPAPPDPAAPRPPRRPSLARLRPGLRRRGTGSPTRRVG